MLRLAREPGKRESRYAHLFSGEPAGDSESESRPGAAAPAPAEDAGDGRLEQLERRVAELETEMAQLRQRLKGPADS